MVLIVQLNQVEAELVQLDKVTRNVGSPPVDLGKPSFEQGAIKCRRQRWSVLSSGGLGACDDEIHPPSFVKGMG